MTKNLTSSNEARVALLILGIGIGNPGCMGCKPHFHIDDVISSWQGQLSVVGHNTHGLSSEEWGQIDKLLTDLGLESADLEPHLGFPLEQVRCGRKCLFLEEFAQKVAAALDAKENKLAGESGAG